VSQIFSALLQDSDIKNKMITKFKKYPTYLYVSTFLLQLQNSQVGAQQIILRDPVQADQLIDNDDLGVFSNLQCKRGWMCVDIDLAEVFKIYRQSRTRPFLREM
jgi:hypothetical protein